ncbi:integrase [Cucumis melo var. makuwa]|uniref:Integrase n=1 Tax=Cucumis melo var. makuwa TaxID=1194695 RepID=A0A5D3D6M8_CUCMM|nr:integrase [Cucumis melo var. makuwa]TYK19219.1 integrase [Cucumis melo var. makuwa]
MKALFYLEEEEVKEEEALAETKEVVVFQLKMTYVKSKIRPVFLLPRKAWRASKPLELVHTDLYCPMQTTTNGGMTPYEAWCGEKPSVSHLRMFRSIAYSHILNQLRGKLDDKSEKCIMVDEKWKIAMDQEIDAIRRNETWELMELPTNKQALRVKWLYRENLKSDGNVEKYKVRLVVKDYKQEYGVDYEEIFAPVTRIEIIQLILSLAAQN